MARFLTLSSVTDVVTNSSTEVFMCRQDDETNRLSEIYKNPANIVFLNTESDVRKFIYGLWKDNSMDYIDHFVDYNPLRYIDWSTYRTKVSRRFDKIWQLFKQPYLSLVGCYVGDDDISCESKEKEEGNRVFCVHAFRNGGKFYMMD